MSIFEKLNFLTFDLNPCLLYDLINKNFIIIINIIFKYIILTVIFQTEPNSFLSIATTSNYVFTSHKLNIKLLFIYIFFFQIKFKCLNVLLMCARMIFTVVSRTYGLIIGIVTVTKRWVTILLIFSYFSK